MMWVGSGIEPRNPDVWSPYNYSYPYYERVNETIRYIKDFKSDLTFLYFEQPDSTGHKYGPESIEYRNKVTICLFFFMYNYFLV
jgi:hypothetical protein